MKSGIAPLVLVLLKVLMSWTRAQTMIPAPENQSVTLRSTVSSVIQSPISVDNPVSISPTMKRNDWWPPIEQEVIQTSSYTPEAQAIPSYYAPVVPAPPLPTIPHYRSESWSPYGYPEYGYPVISPNTNSQLALLTPKYMAIALFIGLLTLFAVIQGTMITKKKEAVVDVLQSRKRRDLLDLVDFIHMTPEQQDILQNDAKVRCIQRTICQENSQLMKDFGRRGAKLAKYLTRSVKKSLINVSGWARLVEDAGAAGLRGEDCSVLYRDCVLPAISKSRKE